MNISVLPEYEVLPGEGSLEMHVLILLEAPPEAAGKQRNPISLCLVIDRSGSMRGEKIKMTRDAAGFIINWLTRRDFASVVTYDSSVELLVPFQPLTDKTLIMESIEKIHAGDSTNLSGGWLRGLSSLEENFKPGNIHRLILMTDGQANAGITDEKELAALADYYRQQGITTTTLGFGDGFNDTLLQSVAGAGGGNFHFVPDSEKMASAFLSEFGDVYKVIGQNLEVTVSGEQGVEILENLSGFQGEVTRARAVMNLGDVYNEEIKHVLLKLRVPARHNSNSKNNDDSARASVVNSKNNDDSARASVVKVAIRYDSVSGGFGVKKASVPLDMEISDGGMDGLTVNHEVRKEVLLGRLARARFRVSELIEKDEIKEAVKVIKEHLSLLDKQDAKHVLPQFGLEKRKLEELLSQLKKQGAGRRLKRQVSADAHSHSTRGRSTYLFPDERRIKAEILRNDQERITEFSDQAEILMEEFDYGESMIKDMVFALKELFSNAVEYGALWCPDKPIRVEFRASKRYVKCIVYDQGPGFDHAKVLEELERNRQPLRPRGRGLLAVRDLVDKLLFRERGNCVEALLFKKLTSVRGGKGHLDQYNVGDRAVMVVPVLHSGLSSEGHVAFREEMKRLMQEGLQFAILDLQEVEYAASIGLGLLAYTLQSLHEAGGEMVLINVGPFLMKLFRTIQFDSIFNIADSVEEALTILSRNT